MAEALTTFAGGFAPRPITYRTIDFRTNEFRGLEGGDRFEPRGGQPDDRLPRRAALHARRPRCFGSSSTRIRRVWDAGHTNLHVMLPFVRTARELRALPRAGRASPACSTGPASSCG